MTRMPSEGSLHVQQLGGHPTVALAARELQRYLAQMLSEDASTHEVRIESSADQLPDAERPTICLGLFTDLEAPERGWPQVPEPECDDAIAIDVCEGHGYIGGVNARSVLLATYRFLTACGCRWPRPGAEGERIPSCTRTDLTDEACETPSYRHRAVCIEGAVSFQNVADMVDWAPKVGLNGYFAQFRESYIFFDRWYRHRNNPLMLEEPFDVERARQFLDSLQEQIAQRGLLYHAVGHGWTCEPLGVPGLGWDADVYTVAPAMRELLAEVNGERHIWRGVPLNTNLCYSNPQARSLVIRAIADYLAAHPNVDLLHFWLADGSNNHCECDTCRDARPSDYYIKMLNELDDLLARRGIGTRIVFLIYVDLLWPPERERLNTPDRFVLMFAPITRSYREPFPSEPASQELPSYRRNALTFPREPGQNVAYLRAWQEQFDGDSFAFEYHLWRAHFADPGQLSITRVLAQDVRALRELRLNGYVSCQVQRAFFPTGLPMHVLARFLWNRDADLEDAIADYFQSAFGGDGWRCRAFLETISALFGELGDLHEVAASDPCRVGLLTEMEQDIHEFQATIAENVAHPDPCVAQSWLYLRHHAVLLRLLAQAIRAGDSGDEAAPSRALHRLEQYVQRHERTLQPVLDVWAYLEAVRRTLGV